MLLIAMEHGFFIIKHCFTILLPDVPYSTSIQVLAMTCVSEREKIVFVGVRRCGHVRERVSVQGSHSYSPVSPHPQMQRQEFIQSKIVDNLADPEDGDNNVNSMLGQRHESDLTDAVDTIADDDPDPVF